MVMERLEWGQESFVGWEGQRGQRLEMKGCWDDEKRDDRIIAVDSERKL